MLMAALGDIRGNFPALKAVMDVLDEEGIHTIVNTGNSIVGAPWPREVITVLRERHIPSVQGELDRRAVRFLRKQAALRKKCSPEEFRALEYAHVHAHSEDLETLRGYPKSLALTVDGVDIHVMHGTLGSQAEVLRTVDPDERFQRQREQALADIIVCGGTVQAFERRVAETLFVNPGSVGAVSVEPSGAHYAIISTETEPWAVEFRQAAYDESMVRARLRETGLADD